MYELITALVILAVLAGCIALAVYSARAEAIAEDDLKESEEELTITNKEVKDVQDIRRSVRDSYASGVRKPTPFDCP